MNKVTKGAIATGVGVLLLVGGGGTLATWNASQPASMGSVVAGNLNLEVNTATNAGKWTNASGTVVNVAAYKVVPGDTLTYTQDLKVTLVGDLMKAKLTVSGAGSTANFTESNVVIESTVLTKDSATVLPGSVLLAADNGKVVSASTTFKFKESTTGRDSVNATYDFSGVGYTLEQLAPVDSNGIDVAVTPLVP